MTDELTYSVTFAKASATKGISFAKASATKGECPVDIRWANRAPPREAYEMPNSTSTEIIWNLKIWNLERGVGELTDPVTFA